VINEKDFITFPQLLSFLFATQVGTGILTLPRVLIREVGTGGWIAIIMGAFIVGIGVICITLLNKLVGDSAFSALPVLLGKPLGWIISIVLIIYLAVLAAVIHRLFVEVVQIWFFPSAPNLILTIFLLVPEVYIVSKGLRVVALYDGLIFIVIATLALVPLHGVINGNTIFLRPIIIGSAGKLFSGTLKVGTSFLGFEMLLFLYPEILGKKRQFWAGVGATALATFFYVGAFVASVTIFGPAQPAYQVYPLLEISRTISLPIIERVDLLFGGLWIVSLITTIDGLLITLVKAVETRFHWRNNISLLVMSILITIMSFFSSSLAEAETVAGIVGIVGMVVGVVFPALLLPVALLRKGAIRKWQKSKSQS
jgi:spore germination protein (amino acid permease)